MAVVERGSPHAGILQPSYSHVRAVRWVGGGETSAVLAATTSDGVAAGELQLLRVDPSYSTVASGTVLPTPTDGSTVMLNGEAVCIASSRHGIVVGTDRGELCQVGVRFDESEWADEPCINVERSVPVVSNGCDQAAVTCIAEDDGGYAIGTEAGTVAFVPCLDEATAITIPYRDHRLCQIPIVSMQRLSHRVFSVCTQAALALWDERVSPHRMVLGPVAYQDPRGEITCTASRPGSEELIYVGARTSQGTGAVHIMDLRKTGDSWGMDRVGQFAVPVDRPGGASPGGQWPVAMSFAGSANGVPLVVATRSGCVYRCNVTLPSATTPQVARTGSSILLPSDIPAPLTSIDPNGPFVAVGSRGSGVRVANLRTDVASAFN